jgi:hypothetical protein
MHVRSASSTAVRSLTGVARGGFDTSTVTAVLAALGLAREHGGAAAALAATGVELPDVARFDGLPADVGQLLGRPASDDAVSEALALGFLAGRVSHRPRAPRLCDPTSFVMDRELVVTDAQGESIRRLPWFEDDLFVGRRLHEISEMPAPVRRLCIEHYSAALAGERGRFTFTSYGHGYSVEAVPVRGDHGNVQSVLAVAVPARSFTAAAMACEETAERLDASATQAEQRAERHGAEARSDSEAAERRVARKARMAAERARVNARLLRSPRQCTPPRPRSHRARPRSSPSPPTASRTPRSPSSSR